MRTFGLLEELSYNPESSEELNLPWDVTGDSLFIIILTKVVAITTIMSSVFFLSFFGETVFIPED